MFLVIDTKLHPSVILSNLPSLSTSVPLINYLLNCAAHLMYRRSLKGHLLREDCKLPCHHPTTLIIKKSTFQPDNITPLLLKDTIINNKYTTEVKTRWLCPIFDSQVSIPQISTSGKLLGSKLGHSRNRQMDSEFGLQLDTFLSTVY